MTLELGFWDGVGVGAAALLITGMAALFVKWHVENEVREAKRDLKSWVREREVSA